MTKKEFENKITFCNQNILKEINRIDKIKEEYAKSVEDSLAILGIKPKTLVEYHGIEYIYAGVKIIDDNLMLIEHLITGTGKISKRTQACVVIDNINNIKLIGQYDKRIH